MKRIIILVTALAMIFSTMIYATAETTTATESNEGIFEITVTDEAGNGLNDVQVYLYSFLDQGIVKSGITEMGGKESLYYVPDEMNSVKSRQYGDFMLYIVKEGYVPTEYNLTKYYINKDDSSQDEREAADRVNEEQINIVLKKDSESNNASMQEGNSEQIKVMNKIQKALIKTNQLSKDNPICVLKNENFNELMQEGTISQAELNSISDVVPTAASASLNNQKVPVGTFHISKQAKLDVTFYSTDSLKVDVGMKNTASGEISCTGSRKRGFGTTSYYAQFTTSNASAKKTYYTMANFEEWTTVSYYGQTYKHIGIKQINGGTETSTASTCSLCNTSYNSLDSLSVGIYIPIEGNSSVALDKFRNSTVNVGAKANIKGGFTVKLGVSRITGQSTVINYRPKAGYKLRIYKSSDSSSIWHCTHTAV